MPFFEIIFARCLVRTLHDKGKLEAALLYLGKFGVQQVQTTDTDDVCGPVN